MWRTSLIQWVPFPTDCYALVAEVVLVDVYLHGMMEEYHSFLENLSFFSFLG